MKKFTLDHNLGQVSFNTLEDAISCMYVLYQYDDHDALFKGTQGETEYIISRLKEGQTYTNGEFSLFM